jgi:hypothetical protein
MSPDAYIPPAAEVQPASSPAATPPVIGFTGKPLVEKKGETEIKEHVPDGSGYFLWRKEKIPKTGRIEWMPYDFIETPENAKATPTPAPTPQKYMES